MLLREIIAVCPNSRMEPINTLRAKTVKPSGTHTYITYYWALNT
jgi:hypothetical protein